MMYTNISLISNFLKKKKLGMFIMSAVRLLIIYKLLIILYITIIILYLCVILLNSPFYSISVNSYLETFKMITINV